jgi:hypothetical protein
VIGLIPIFGRSFDFHVEKKFLELRAEVSFGGSYPNEEWKYIGCRKGGLIGFVLRGANNFLGF